MPRSNKTAVGEVDQLDLVAAINEAALEPGQWPRALARMAGLFGARGAGLGVGTLGPSGHAEAWEHGFPGLDVNQHQMFENPWLTRVLQLFPGTATRSDDFMSLEELHRTPFYHDVVRPLEIDHLMGVTFLARQQVMICTVAHSARQGPFDDAALERFRKIAPHLVQAARVRLRLQQAEAFKDAALELLDRLAHGILLLDEQGEICFANRSAEQLLAADDGLTSTNRRPVASQPDESRRLRELVAAAIRTGIGRGVHPGGAMLVSRADRRPLELLVAPLVARRLSLAVGRPVAVVLIDDPDEPVRLETERLRELYQLTPGEARVARAVARGQGLEHVARELGLRITSVRSHLQSCFEKTGTSRQAELVRLLLGISAALQ
jgi:DNA-binding CsgD family transcriptional regulator